MAFVSCVRVLVKDGFLSRLLPYIYTPVSPDVYRTLGLPLPERGPVYLPARFLFSNNTALVGGALYIRKVIFFSFGANERLVQWTPDPESPGEAMTPITETSESQIFAKQPAVVLSYNTANGGAGMYLEGNDAVSL